MQSFSFIGKLAERVSKRTGKKIYPDDIEMFFFKLFMLVVFMVFAVVLWYVCSGLSENNAAIASAFVQHFLTLK